jgi:hypothetical protein
MEELASLLEPFAAQTDILQRDSQALSSIIPALLDLECHLLQHEAPKALTSSMLRDLRHRFESILQPTAPDFNPLPAAACLLEPSLSSVIMQPEQAGMLHAAKTYIIEQCGSFLTGLEPVPTTTTSNDDSTITSNSALGRFRFLSSKLKSQEHRAAHNTDAAVTQITRYMTEAAEAGDVKGIDFWSSRQSTYSSIVPLAEDMLAAPASQAFVERVFSLCGLLTAGRRNRTSQSLEMRAFLKLNRHIC